MKEKVGLALMAALYMISIVYKGRGGIGNLDERTMEGAFFQGGYGMEWLYDAGKEFERAHPGYKAYIWGNPRVWDQTRTRFLAGNPPDVFWGIHNINIWVNLQEGLVAPLDSLMEAPAYGQEHIKFKDSFLPGALDSGRYEGHQYFLPITFAVLGLWYNVNMFEEHGWRPPKTWEEFLELCDEIKATGIAPLVHQGRYPSYYGIIFRALLYKIGGYRLLVDLDNLVPGAWERPDVVRAARMCRELIDRGYVLEGSSAFTHTEAQMVWLQGKAAMVPCGTWLENEMKEAIPPGFRMRIMPLPAVSGGKGSAEAIEASAGADLWVPAQAKHKELGMEFLRILLSKKMARNFVRKVGDLMPIKGATEGVEIPEALQSALDAVREAKGETFYMRFTDWYEEMEDGAENALAALLYEGISPEEFAYRIEMIAQRIREDPTIVKYHRELPERIARR
ncbi:MAG TPA: extracellular solute-binding protein [Candidatus Latescibacteria bacterium]|nr:extracellular solute-binding protein [Candidatus Latescibacterota bacterium]